MFGRTGHATRANREAVGEGIEEPHFVAIVSAIVLNKLLVFPDSERLFITAPI